MTRTTGMAIALLLLNVGAYAQSQDANLQGVWKIVEVTSAGPNAVTTSSQPGMYIFTAKHYANVLVTADKPRPALPADANQATVAELRAVYDPFIASAGTYEFDGTSLTIRPKVSKNPRSMVGDYYGVYKIKLEANTMWLTPGPTSDGPRPNPRTFKLVRIE